MLRNLAARLGRWLHYTVSILENKVLYGDRRIRKDTCPFPVNVRSTKQTKGKYEFLTPEKLQRKWVSCKSERLKFTGVSKNEHCGAQ